MKIRNLPRPLDGENMAVGKILTVDLTCLKDAEVGGALQSQLDTALCNSANYHQH